MAFILKQFRHTGRIYLKILKDKVLKRVSVWILSRDHTQESVESEYFCYVVKWLMPPLTPCHWLTLIISVFSLIVYRRSDTQWPRGLVEFVWLHFDLSPLPRPLIPTVHCHTHTKYAYLISLLHKKFIFNFLEFFLLKLWITCTCIAYCIL